MLRLMNYIPSCLCFNNTSRNLIENNTPPPPIYNITPNVNRPSYFEGTQGHRRNMNKCGQFKTHRLIDKRYKHSNKKASTCIRDKKTGERIVHRNRRNLQGIIEPKNRECTRCNIIKPQRKFQDMRVLKKDRLTIRNTIICSDCKPKPRPL